MPTRVLVLTFDPLTDAMAGPAIRAWQLAQVLASRCTVTLASTVTATRHHDDMHVCAVEAGTPDLAALVAQADVVFAPTSVARRHPEVRSSAVPLVIDMYIPTHLENLERGDAGPTNTSTMSRTRCRSSTTTSPGAISSSVPVSASGTSGSARSPTPAGSTPPSTTTTPRCGA